MLDCVSRDLGRCTVPRTRVTWCSWLSLYCMPRLMVTAAARTLCEWGYELPEKLMWGDRVGEACETRTQHGRSPAAWITELAMGRLTEAAAGLAGVCVCIFGAGACSPRCSVTGRLQLKRPKWKRQWPETAQRSGGFKSHHLILPHIGHQMKLLLILFYYYIKLKSQVLRLKPDRSKQWQRNNPLTLPLHTSRSKRPANNSKLLSIPSCASLSYSGSVKKTSMVNSGQPNVDSPLWSKENQLFYLGQG